MGNPTAPFYEVGSVTDKINVAISLQIIGLFSEGLYSSPNKAIEELVSNSFDADATKVHIAVSPDRAAFDSSIAVIDNGTGMGDEGLKIHWIVGDSIKSANRTTKSGRRSIGKFGIGKLAAYVLGDRLTHVTKHGGKYYSTSMDFGVIPKTADVARVDEPADARRVQLDLRELDENEARAALGAWLAGDADKAGIQLFGADAESTWTVAVVSDLKPMAADLQLGRLRWVLSTALPLRDDFALYLNGKPVDSSKMSGARVGTWTLGKEIKELPRPANVEFESETDPDFDDASYKHWHIVDRLLGPITGYVEIFQEPIVSGKSDEVGRSNGFFVYVHGRLVNPDDAGFGIDRNLLRHGTFSRLRVVVNMDRLDNELRSSRESLRDGPVFTRAQEILQGIFNFARSKYDKHEASLPNERRAAQRLSESPASLTERPVLRMMLDAFEGNYEPRHLEISKKSEFEDSAALLALVHGRIESDAGLFNDVSFAELGVGRPIAVYDPSVGSLTINNDHQFVAHFSDQFGDSKKNLPLQLLAISEIILEAQLYDSDVAPGVVQSVLEARDELLRNLAKGSGIRNSVTVAQELVSAVSSKKGLEAALVDAFDQLGFDALPRGGNGQTDGIAVAKLAATSEGVKAYRVSLEAKSKESVGAKVKKKDVEVSTIARHRDDEKCDHAIVVGPEFETGAENTGALVQEIDADRASNPGKTITLMRADDLARLIRIAPLKRLNLEQIRGLFAARTPDESAVWVAQVESQSISQAPYKQILEGVWHVQEDQQDHSVSYGYLRAILKTNFSLDISETDLKTDCLALSRIAANQFYYFDDRVELKIKPDTVLELVNDYIQGVPDEGGQ